jgi:uncharacterized protein (TIGR02271 family)
MQFDSTQATSFIGSDLYDRDGDKVGSITEIYEDTQTRKPEWAAINTGFFGSKVAIVPLTQATTEGESLRVPFEKAQIKDAPHVDADGQISQQEEAALYSHYGLDYSEDRSDTGLPEGGATTEQPRETVGHDTSGPTTDDAMTRSEEEVVVGKQQVETGRARLRKYIVTENVETTIPVQREEVRIEREPITEGNIDNALDGPELSEEEHEVVLHAEEPVVGKKTVPKERVRLDKTADVENVKVSEQARKEQIEVEGVDETTTRR